jgi:hypothetical protein
MLKKRGWGRPELDGVLAPNQRPFLCSPAAEPTTKKDQIRSSNSGQTGESEVPVTRNVDCMRRGLAVPMTLRHPSAPGFAE